MRCNMRRGVPEEEAPAVGENGGLEENPLLPEGYFEFEAIRKKRMNKGKAEYLIKWVGWPESANTWEPYEHLEGCAEDVEAFEQRTQQRRRKSVQPTRTLIHEEETNGGINPNSDHQEETNGGRINPSNHQEETNGGINPPDNKNHGDDPDIVKIIRLVRTEVSNDELLVTFAVLRSDGKEVMADNRYLKLLYPRLLISYYERRCLVSTPSDDQEHINEV